MTQQSTHHHNQLINATVIATRAIARGAASITAPRPYIGLGRGGGAINSNVRGGGGDNDDCDWRL